MSIYVSMHEGVANGRGDAMDDIGEATPVRAKEGAAGSVGGAVDPKGKVSRVEHSVNRVDLDEARPKSEDSAGEDSGSMGTDIGAPMAALFEPKLDDRAFAVDRARVFEALFQVPAEPQQLGRYVVLGTLGKGGMGTVLEAFDRTLDRKVAVKVLHQELDQKHTARLLREAQAMAKLSHPNVVPVFDAGTVGGQTFVAMELVEGLTLKAWMKQDPRPDWRQCVQVFIQAGQGLAAAHAQGLIHRDFKPGNAIVDDQGRARVLDFGLARWTEINPTEDEGPGRARDQTKDDPPVGSRAPQRIGSGMMGGRTMRARGNDEPALDQALTRTGAVIGTPAYMPPEQMLGQRVDARSDQFSFCVALYEAVYGERPFEGRSVPALMAAVTSGEVRPVPKESSVPARLRAVLLRGLAVEPAKRWPSMEALLNQLRTLVAPRTRRWMALGVTAGLAALGAGLAMPRVLEMQDRCTGAPTQMEGIWDDARRQQVQAALLGTEVSFAPGTWQRIGPQLDDYAQAWMDTHTEACEATRVHGDQTPEEMSLRMRCLDRRRTALRASVDQFVDADVEVVTNAVKLVAGLPTLTRCDDLLWLEQQNQRVPPPEDPDVAAAVEVQRASLADAEATDRAGRYADALDEIKRIAQQAEALDYPPLWAEALYWQGVLRNRNGQYADAERDLRRAHTLAVEHHHDSVALDTAQVLTSVVGLRLARHAEGRQWGEMEALPLAQRSGELLEEAESLNSLGVVYHAQGDYASARVYHQRAIVIREKALGPNHPYVADSLNNLGNVLASQGDYDKARVHYQRALEIVEKVLGPEHPRVAGSLNSLGDMFSNLGEYEKARIHIERSLEIASKALGSDHPVVAYSLNNLGNLLSIQGDYDKARLCYEQALAIREKVLGPNHPLVADNLDNLGLVYDDQGKLENALVHFERALAIREKALGPDHPDVAYSLNNLGNLLSSRGDYDKTQVHFERALAIWEEALGPDHPNVAGSLNNLGNLYDNQGELEKAWVHHQRALVIWEKALGPDHRNVALSLGNLGSVFHRQGELDKARVHHQRALAIWEKALGPDHPDVAMSLGNLGNVLSSQGAHERARVHHQRALEIRENALGPDHPDVAYSLVGLATACLEMGHPDLALRHVERAVSIREVAAVAPALLAETRFMLARALWNMRSKRTRARALAQQARDALAAAEGPGDSDVSLAEVEAWLATHRAR